MADQEVQQHDPLHIGSVTLEPEKRMPLGQKLVWAAEFVAVLRADEINLRMLKVLLGHNLTQEESLARAAEKATARAACLDGLLDEVSNESDEQTIWMVEQMLKG